ncbi:MAG: hypothetical protein IE880_07360 [Epsilonproteobacteria bacterium]|nr:hypothetical protein [Campylobacterota bacterium]
MQNYEYLVNKIKRGKHGTLSSLEFHTKLSKEQQHTQREANSSMVLSSLL